MSIDANGVTFLLHAGASGARFERTATLGRQRLALSAMLLRSRLKRFGCPGDAQAILTAEDRYAEPLLRHLGAQSIHSFDASAYEGATDVHDLNTPIPAQYKQRFTAVLDGGTLEHIFNFPVAIRNAMEMVEGGHYLAISPTNNYAGHGFYQFSAEVYFRVLSAENGFRIVRVLSYEDWPWARWYEVIDPAVAGRRVTLVNHRPTRVAVIAQRVAVREILARFPIQTDYVRTWETPMTPRSGWLSAFARTAFVRAVTRAIPGNWRHALVNWKDALDGKAAVYRRIDPTRLS